MQRLGFALTSLVLVATFGMSACSPTGSASVPSNAPGGAAGDGAQQVSVTVGNNMSFEPAAITVRAGQPVQVTLHNTGFMPHDFTLSDGVAQPVKITASGGQTVTGSFIIEAPGAYSFDCSMPGHAAAGMHGTISAQ